MRMSLRKAAWSVFFCNPRRCRQHCWGKRVQQLKKT